MKIVLSVIATIFRPQYFVHCFPSFVPLYLFRRFVYQFFCSSGVWKCIVRYSNNISSTSTIFRPLFPVLCSVVFISPFCPMCPFFCRCISIYCSSGVWKCVVRYSNNISSIVFCPFSFPFIVPLYVFHHFVRCVRDFLGRCYVNLFFKLFIRCICIVSSGAKNSDHTVPDDGLLLFYGM